MNSRKCQVLLLLALCLIVAVGAYAQTSTSGGIEGKVTDKSGAIMPGVTLELRSPNLQGTKTDVSDANGQFRFNLLPPGNYSLTATLSGFSPVQQQGIIVQLAHTVTLDVRMSPVTTETITVTAAAPVVDVKSTTTGQNMTTQTMQSLPIGRNFVAASAVAPGVQADATGPTVYGSSGAENSYIIDGLNTTSLRSGLQGKQAPVEFIQEVDTMTGGLPAEYGRMTGGTINAITKSGGNTYTGDVFGYDAAKALRSDNKTFTERPGTAGSAADTKQILDLGGDLGGYFVKDRIWFFGAYDHQNRTNTSTRINAPLNLANYQLPVGAVLDTKVKNDLYAGKLTFRLTDSQNLSASLIGDPTTTSGPIFAIAGPPSTFMGELKTGGTDYNARYNGVFGSTFLVDAIAGRHNEQSSTSGPGTEIPQLRDATVSPNVNTGGFAFFSKEKYNRTIGKLDLSKYLSNHDLKFGGDFEDLKANVQSWQGGQGQLIYKLVTNTGQIYYRHRYYINDLAPGFDRANPATWVIAAPLVVTPEDKNVSAYVQDSWRVLSNFTVNAGVRWESQEVVGRNNVKAFKLNSNWAPRLGLIWDVQNNGRSKLYANYGRFFESIPMDINIRAFGGELVCFCYNLSPDPANYLQSANAPRRQSTLGGSTEPVDANLKGQHIDELIGGYDYEIGPNLKIGVQGTYRKLANVIEDMLIGTTGEYLIANPGSGIGREAGFYEGGTVVTPPAKRTYKGVEIHAEKRFSNNYQFFASYLWSRLEGNYDGTFQASTGQLDPNINSAFDYADFIVNNHGLLSNDRTHQLKFYGSYEFSGSSPMRGLQLGVGAHYASGTPLTAVGYSFAYQNWEYYLTPRGSLGRGPANYEADLHVGYPIQVGNGIRVNLLADVFNILNLQRKTTVDLRYNRIQDGTCGGFVVPSGKQLADVCTGDGGLVAQTGTVNPVSTVNPSAAPNPDFLKAGTAFTDPRQIRFGVRVTF
jgi:hypothetical protein